jgi:23S rRNA (cytidine1920-2'-O)/16S rRNA (cytidine1409-2'-O)-methyltransferase
LTTSRSQAESWIKLGRVTVNNQAVIKSSYFVNQTDDVKLTADEQYVSRAGLKLDSVVAALSLDFRNKIIIDVGSSTGGFSDFALRHGAKKVYAIELGTNQLNPKLRGDKRIELHEKTDIRDFYLNNKPDIILIDVSFVSLRDILPHIHNHLSGPNTQIVAMVKPQFEASDSQTNRGVIKNDTIRRQILKSFEDWARQYFIIRNKRDSDIAGAKGNRERFYLLTLNRNSTTSPGSII